MSLKTDFYLNAREVGLFVYRNEGPFRLVLSIDQEIVIKRLFVPDIRKKGGDTFVYGQIVLALRKKNPINTEYSYIARDIQNIRAINIGNANIAEKAGALGFLYNIKTVLGDMPASVEDIKMLVSSNSGWISDQIVNYNLISTIDFRETLLSY